MGIGSQKRGLHVQFLELNCMGRKCSLKLLSPESKVKARVQGERFRERLGWPYPLPTAQEGRSKAKQTSHLPCELSI
jgi:hypothetical protein